MNTLARSTALTAAAALVGGGLLVSAAPANADSIFVIRVNENETSSTDPAHNPPQKGDTFTFKSDLKQKGKRVGTDAGACEFLKLLGPASKPTGAKVRCDVTFTFTKGTIRVLGTTTFPFSESDTRFRVPIVSGSGKFANAKGNVTVHEVTDTKSHLVFRLRNFS